MEYFDSYGVANLLPEINKFIVEMPPFNHVGYNFVNLQNFSDESIFCLWISLLYFAMKHKKPELCVTDFYKAYPNNGHDQHINELHVNQTVAPGTALCPCVVSSHQLTNR